jgi:protein TonB
MPRDLFDAVVSRPPSVRARRAPFVSVIAHALGLAAAVVASLVGSDTLPAPHEALAYFETAARMADVPLPPPPPRPALARLPMAPGPDPDAAPTVAPEGIRPDTGIEHDVASRQDAGVVVGFGDPAGFALERVPDPPPSPPQAPAAPIRLHSGIRAPVKLMHVAPVYPGIALQARVEGVVILEATIDVDGHVTSAKVLRSIPLLDQAAVDAVRQWQFTPTLLNGVAVPVIMTVTVSFTLGNR